MKKWEYKVQTYVSTSDLPEQRAADVEAFLNICGESGWELVCRLDKNDGAFVFKRKAGKAD